MENQNTNPTTEQTNEQSTQATETPTPSTGEELKFSQADVDRIVAERLSRKSKAEPEKESKQEEKKTDAQKTEPAENNDEFIKLKSDVERMQSENIALRLGVPSDNVQKVLKLAAISEETDKEKAITAVLEEFPMLKGGEEKEIPKKAGSAAKAGKTEVEPTNLHDAIAQVIASKK